MAVCERCGEEFDEDEADAQFASSEWLLSYENIHPTLCGQCAIQAIDDREDGVYFETCENCGYTFDLFEAEYVFGNRIDGVELRDAWEKDGRVLCGDCGADVFEDDMENQEE